MKQATVTIPGEVDQALAAYRRDRHLSGDLSAVIDAALRDHLAAHGYLVPPRPFRPLRITPIPHDGDETDVSINHDRYLADWELSKHR